MNSNPTTSSSISFTDRADVSFVRSRTVVRNGSQSVDRTIGYNGKTKSARLDLGLALLQHHGVPGIRYDFTEIAAWAGCSDTAIVHIYRRALRKLRDGLRRAGVGVQEVDDLLRILRRGSMLSSADSRKTRRKR